MHNSPRSYARARLTVGATLFAVCTSLSLAQTSPAQTFTRIIGSGDPLPNGGVFPVLGVSTPAIGGGTIAFSLFYNDGVGLPSVLYKFRAGTFERVIGLGETVPGWGGRVLGSASRIAVDTDGSVALVAHTPFTTQTQTGVLTDRGGTLRALADNNTQIPGSSSRLTTIANQSFRADGGYVVFSGGGRVGVSAISGVFSVPTAGGPLRTLMLENQFLANGDRVFGTGSADVRDGRAAFEAFMVPPGAINSIRRIYTAAADGSGTPLEFVSGDDINPITGAPFGIVNRPIIDEDDIAFYGWRGSLLDIHSTSAPPLQAGTVLPTGATAGILQAIHFDRERIVFDAWDAAFTASHGLFLYASGAITTVIAPGDVIDGRTVDTFAYGDEALDGDSLAIFVLFTDGQSAVYRVDLTTFANYGEGLAGEFGLTPRIEGFGRAAAGSTFHVELRDGGSSMLAGIFFGLAPLNQPILGGTVLVRPDAVGTIALQAPAPGLSRPWASVPFALPLDPSLPGLDLYMQVHYADPAATQGVSMSDGLRATVQ